MPSPFPGIDPYIEGQHRWPDFRSRLTNSFCETISESLPEFYVASIDERVEIREIDSSDEPSTFKPDVAVLRDDASRRNKKPITQSSAGASTAVTLNLPAIEEEHARHIEIRHRPDNKLVAIVELLSPTNKQQPGRAQYLAKRADLLLQDIHLIELDLLVGGRPLPMERSLPTGHFYAIVARSDFRPAADVYAWTLRDRFPIVAVPLAKPDNDVLVDLHKAYNAAYSRGRYERMLDYRKPLSLALRSDDAEWAANLAQESVKQDS
jgi:hypothetical protein